jgi:penicillin amidase
VTRGFRRADEPLDEWRGFVPYEQLPAERDPQRGWTGSANNRPARPSYPVPLYGSYADGQRMRRIRALLDGSRDVTPEYLGAMQNDTFSNRAADVCPHLVVLLDLRAEWLDAIERHALAQLRRWDFQFEVDRTGASVFQAFWLAWTGRVAAERFPKHLARMATAGCAYVAHQIITVGDGAGGLEPWFPRSQAHAEIEAAFRQAVAWLRERLGDDPSRWTWGELHPVTFRHALAARLPACTELSVGPFPCPGSTGVLNQNGFAVRERYETTGGPHFRLLVDLASPDTALGAHTTGNSGHPGSPYYANHTEDWLTGRYHPMLMDPAAVEAHAAGTFVVRPERSR